MRPARSQRRHGFLRRLVHDSHAATAIEYGLILALIALTIMGSVRGLADVTTGMWNNVSDKVQRAR